MSEYLQAPITQIVGNKQPSNRLGLPVFRFLQSIFSSFFGPWNDPDPRLYTIHARERMRERRITKTDVNLAIAYGRVVSPRGTAIYSVGRREIKAVGEILRRCQDVCVVCDQCSGVVLTAYKRSQKK